MFLVTTHDALLSFVYILVNCKDGMLCTIGNDLVT